MHASTGTEHLSTCPETAPHLHHHAPDATVDRPRMRVPWARSTAPCMLLALKSQTCLHAAEGEPAPHQQQPVSHASVITVLNCCPYASIHKVYLHPVCKRLALQAARCWAWHPGLRPV